MTIFYQGNPTASTNNLVYTTTSAGTYNVLGFNPSSSVSIQVLVGIVPNGNSVGSTSWIFGASVDPLQDFEKDGIPLAVGDMIYVNPSAGGIAISVIGVVPT